MKIKRKKKPVDETPKKVVRLPKSSSEVLFSTSKTLMLTRNMMSLAACYSRLEIHADGITIYGDRVPTRDTAFVTWEELSNNHFEEHDIAKQFLVSRGIKSLGE